MAESKCGRTLDRKYQLQLCTATIRNEDLKYMKYKNVFFLALSSVCFLTAFLLSMAFLQKRDEALAAHIAPEVIRFHVLANSDSSEDQQLKLEVKEMLLQSMYEALGDSVSKDDTTIYIRTHKEELEKKAEAFMGEKGYEYKASLELTEDYFPTKAYGDMVFPSGTYQACRITLGAGKGKNWWCVLYPPLCFIDSTYAVVPDQSKDMLQTVLPEDDFSALMANRRLNWTCPSPSQDQNMVPECQVRIKFKVWECLKNIS